MPQLSNITVEPAELILLCESSDDIADQAGRIGLVEDVRFEGDDFAWVRRGERRRTRWFGKEKFENEHLLKI